MLLHPLRLPKILKKPDQRVLPPSIASPSKFTVLGTLPNTSPVGPILKETCKILTVLEPYMENFDSAHIISECVSPHWGWVPRENTKKTKKFYQLILIDTHSADIIPEYDKTNPSLVNFSKLKIKRIISEKEWNQHPLTEKKFSRVFDPLPIIILIIKKVGIKSCTKPIIVILGIYHSQIHRSWPLQFRYGSKNGFAGWDPLKHSSHPQL